MDMNTKPARPAGYNKDVALVLQGGGALGSYQAGVYEALSASDYQPTWIAGISIGAINAAIIAGNPPERRVERLRAFWDEITSSTSYLKIPSWFDGVDRSLGAAGALLFGQPGFFAPRPVTDWLHLPQVNSYYTTAALRSTLDRLVDFDIINAKTLRFSVGAVNVRTGQFAYFDNHSTEIRAEHIMASGALPPGFPPVEINGEFYWDGGLVSNTPLQYVLDIEPRISRLTFQVDLFQAYGAMPQTLDEVAEREKDIRYASRTRTATATFQDTHNLRAKAHNLLQAMPESARKMPEAAFLSSLACTTEMDIVELIYRPFEPQGSTKDIEFSRNAMLQRWDQGRRDAETTLAASPWLEPNSDSLGTRVFDVLHDIYVAKVAAGEPMPRPAKTTHGT